VYIRLCQEKSHLSIPEVPYPITQRGNNRQDVFFVDDDRHVYLSILKEQSEKYGIEILGWCLMTHHIHRIARPSTSESLVKAVGRTHFLYTQNINTLHSPLTDDFFISKLEKLLNKRLRYLPVGRTKSRS
jgi:REP element-mobilizing transposase RayT